MQFSLAEDTPGDLCIYDTHGRRIATLEQGILRQGARSLAWGAITADGRPAAAGIYFVRLETRNFTRTAKFALQR